jgi:hypothetical protein
VDPHDTVIWALYRTLYIKQKTGHSIFVGLFYQVHPRHQLHLLPPHAKHPVSSKRRAPHRKSEKRGGNKRDPARNKTDPHPRWTGMRTTAQWSVRMNLGNPLYIIHSQDRYFTSPPHPYCFPDPLFSRFLGQACTSPPKLCWICKVNA